MNEHEKLKLARKHLADEDFDVWFAKHYNGYGRFMGAHVLGITPEQFRTRLHRADRTMRRVLEEAA